MTQHPLPLRRAWWKAATMGAVLAFALLHGIPAQADVILFPSQPSYGVGQQVEFSLVNATEHVIHFRHTSWWAIHDAQGVMVEGCNVLPLNADIEPGDSHSWSWDQIHCANKVPVPPGRYRLTTTYASECCPGDQFAIETFFDIGAAPVEPASWGRIKAVFDRATR